MKAAVLGGREVAPAQPEPKPEVERVGRSVLDRRRREVEQAEAEQQAALHACAAADAGVREVERAVRKAWDAASAEGAQDGECLERLAELRAQRATATHRKLEAHHSADLMAERVGAVRLTLEATEAAAKRLRAQIAQHETTIAALRRSVALAERQLVSRREAFEAEREALRQLERQLSDLAGG
jgi:chromosome segregation ATPase